MPSNSRSLMGTHWLSVLFVLVSLAGPAAFAQEVAAPKDGSTSAQTSEVGVRDAPEDSEERRRNMFRLELLTYLGFLAVGASIGSFLNVVVYRLPNGRSVFGNSKCPQCDEAIQWRDNIPIIGWLRLKGRCRACNVWIPVRYPSVEALIGGVFILLLAIELVTGGENLPVRFPNHSRGVIWIIWYTKWDLIGIYLFHCCLTCVVIAAALMQWDGHPLPKRLKQFAIGTGIIAPIFWSHLHPVAAMEPRLDWLRQNWQWKVEFTDPVTGWPQYFGVGLDGLINSAVGLIGGLVTGWLITRSLGSNAFPRESREQHRNGLVVLFGAVAAFLGWQSVAPLAISFAVLAAAISFISVVSGDSGLRLRTTNAAFAIAVLIHICLWRKFSFWDWCPDHTGWPILNSVGWWPSIIEPYGSLAVAVAVGCLIAGTVRVLGLAGADRESLRSAG